MKRYYEDTSGISIPSSQIVSLNDNTMVLANGRTVPADSNCSGFSTPGPDSVAPM